jgi:hypothetical protein
MKPRPGMSVRLHAQASGAAKIVDSTTTPAPIISVFSSAVICRGVP